MEEKKNYKILSEKLNNKEKPKTVFNSISKNAEGKLGSSSPNSDKKTNSPPKIKKQYKPLPPVLPVRLKIGRRDKRKVVNVMWGILPFVFVAVLIFFAVYMLIRKNATEVMVNGTVVGQVLAKDMKKEDLMTMLNQQLEQQEASKVQIVDTIEVKPVHGKKKLLLDEAELNSAILKTLKFKVEAAEITVNGSSIGIVRNQKESQEIFKLVMNKYVSEEQNITSSKFVEDVKVANVFVFKDKIGNNGAIQAELEKTTVIPSTYTVVSGDTPTKIAANHNMTFADLKAQNATTDFNKPLQIDQTLQVTVVKPFISVQTEETKVETVELKRDIQEQKDARLAPGQKKVIDQGKDGKQEITTKVIRINGNPVSAEKSEPKIIENPEPQIVAVG